MSDSCMLGRAGSTALVFLVLPWSILLHLDVAAAAQERVVAGCEQCEMRAELIAELGTEDGDGILGNPAHVARRADGSWIVLDYMDGGRVQSFDSTGAFVRAVGQRGRGPGEYLIAERVEILPSDSVRVVDFAGMRITTLSPSLSLAGTSRMATPGQAIAFLSGGRHVVSAIVNTAASVGLPVHVVSPDGQLLRSLGADPPVSRLDGNTMWRSLATTPNDEIWIGHLLSYRVEKWSDDGRLLGSLYREVDWFPPQTSYGAGDHEPSPGMPFIDLDKAGNIWTVVRVADQNWRLAVEEVPDPYGRPTRQVVDRNRYYDSIVEVIDPVRAAVVQRIRLDDNVLGFAGDGLVFTTRIVEPGFPVVQVWKLAPPSPFPKEGR